MIKILKLLILASSSDFAAALDVAIRFNDTQRRDCFHVTIANDKLVEQNENFELELRLLSGSTQSGVVFQPLANRAIITIVDDGKFL